MHVQNQQKQKKSKTKQNKTKKKKKTITGLLNSAGQKYSVKVARKAVLLQQQFIWI